MGALGLLHKSPLGLMECEPSPRLRGLRRYRVRLEV